MQTSPILAPRDLFNSLISPSGWDKTKELVTSIAIPILLGVGAALCATHFFPLVTAIGLDSVSAVISGLSRSAVCGLSSLALGVTLYVTQFFAFKYKTSQVVQQATSRFQEKWAELEPVLMRLGFDIPDSMKVERIEFPLLSCLLTDYELNAGSIKSLFLASSPDSSDYKGCLAVSKLASQGHKFDQYALDDEVFAVWTKVAAQNPHGGLGQIIDKKVVQLPEGGRIQYLVQPFFNRQNLFIQLQNGKFTLSDRLNMADDLLSALALMQENSLVHGDIKPDNIQLNWDGKRLGAFLIDTDTAFIQTESAKSASKRGLIGAPSTWAPEIFATKEDNDLNTLDRLKTDVWSLGLVFMMLFVEEPGLITKIHENIDGDLEEKNRIRENFQKNTGLTKPSKAANLLKKWLNWDKVKMLAPEFEAIKPILVGMLQPLAQDRFTAQEALAEWNKMRQKFLGKS